MRILQDLRKGHASRGCSCSPCTALLLPSEQRWQQHPHLPSGDMGFSDEVVIGICKMSLGTMCACTYCHVERKVMVLDAASIHSRCCLGAYLGGHWPRDASRLPLPAVSLLACRASIPARPAMERRSFRLQMPVSLHARAWPAKPKWLCKHKVAITLQTLQNAI